jgi:hypothetical protein
MARGLSSSSQVTVAVSRPSVCLHTAMRPDLMPPERIVAVLRLQLDALDREAEPKAPTARG